MTEQVFQFGMDKLQRVFGERFYPKERIQEYWSLVLKYDDVDFQDFVSRCVREAERPPLGPKFAEFAETCEKKIYERNKQNLAERLRLGQVCRSCGDEGLVLAIKKQDGSKWAFLCSDCKTVDRMGPKFREMGGHNAQEICTWRHDLSERYHLHRVIDHVFSEGDEILRRERSSGLQPNI